ncbi:hypothetical protein [Pseudomonas lactis]|uniref:hypothetical protein n=1 Tax=Pseudomonas lactis TaxID=1615674 RepID=UPI00190A1519|nr:hypothetical protein [Pseudomonas lactis]MBK3444127.1 hypothetical protein [Pseudomonas lactis]
MKKQERLGMCVSTAKSRLAKDTLFRLLIESGHACFRCGGALTRESFSIEHKESWVNSDNPVEKFFDQSNIAFSHISCNSAAGGASPRMDRLTPGVAASRIKESKRRHWTSAKRREKYLRLGT